MTERVMKLTNSQGARRDRREKLIEKKIADLMCISVSLSAVARVTQPRGLEHLSAVLANVIRAFREGNITAMAAASALLEAHPVTTSSGQAINLPVGLATMMDVAKDALVKHAISNDVTTDIVQSLVFLTIASVRAFEGGNAQAIRDAADAIDAANQRSKVPEGSNVIDFATARKRLIGELP